MTQKLLAAGPTIPVPEQASHPETKEWWWDAKSPKFASHLPF